MADAHAKAEAYDKALHELEYATALATKAATEAEAADDELNDATTDLGTALNELTQAQSDYDDALEAYNNALNTYKIKRAAVVSAKADYEASMKKLYGKEDGGTSGATAAANPTTGAWTADSLYGKYKAAEKARTDAGIPNTYAYTANKGISDEFDAYKAADSTVEANVYTDLDTAGLKKFRDWVDANTSDEEHDHWMLVIDELIAKTNYNNEKAKCLGSDVGNTNYNNAADGTLGKAYKDALTEYNTAYQDLGDTDINTDPDIGLIEDGTVVQKFTDDKTAKKTLTDATTTLETKQGNYDDALDAWNDAVEASEAANEIKDTADALKAAAQKAHDAAQALYDVIDADAVSVSDGSLKIYIKLNDDAVITAQGTGDTNAQWLLKPVAADGSLVNNTAVFYYTGLLEGGETSSKLIDYVLLDPKATQNDYKNFEFDINVALKSAQINLDESGNIKTDAAASELGQFATLDDNTDVDTFITWTDTI